MFGNRTFSANYFLKKKKLKALLNIYIFLMRNFKIDYVINRKYVLLYNCENMKMKMT